MALERTEVTLSVELEAAPPGQPPRRLRLEARFRAGAGTPSAAELAEAVTALDRDLAEATKRAGFFPTAPPRAERSVSDLVEAYRPRQPELVELLLAEGEVSPGEAEALRQYLAGPLGVAAPARSRARCAWSRSRRSPASPVAASGAERKSGFCRCWQFRRCPTAPPTGRRARPA